MRFPHIFDRWVGSTDNPAAVMLGDDPVPQSRTYKLRTNVFETRISNTDGYPVQRIALGWYGPRPKIGIAAYLWDDCSEHWYQVHDDPNASCGWLCYIDVPALADCHRVGLSSPGPIEVAIRPYASDKPQSGRYVFVMGAAVGSPAGP